MRWQVKKEINESVFYVLILGLALSRVLTSKILSCPADFDCNSYIQMANSIAYDEHILPHHAMRILPALLAKGLMMLGMSLHTAFRLLSDGTYVLFGGLIFWVLRQYELKAWVAFAFTLLCLAPYHAMRIPLQNVYQACDIMTYPLSLLLFHFSLQKKIRWVFAIALISIFVRQNLLVLGEFSLLYCFWQTRRKEALGYILALTSAYLVLQWYYHAFSIVTHHMIPDASFFSLSHILWIIEDSKILAILIPIAPFIIIYFKQGLLFFCRNWHVAMYVGASAGQPFLAYHLTGNNYARLALQGLWLIFLAAGFLSKGSKWSNSLVILFVTYALAIYFSWGIPQRLLYMGLFSVGALFILLIEQRAKTRELASA